MRRLLALALLLASARADGPGRVIDTSPGVVFGGLAQSAAALPIVAVGTNLAVYSSDDGATWSTGTMPAGQWKSVAYTGSGYIAIDSNSVNVASTGNGQTWTVISTLPADTWNAVWCDSTNCVASGNTALAISSNKGATWTSKSSNGVVNMASITGTPTGVYCAMSSLDAARSADFGATWTANGFGSGPPQPPAGPAAWNGSLFVVSFTGSGFFSPAVARSATCAASSWTGAASVAAGGQCPNDGVNPTASGVAWSTELGIFAVIGNAANACTSPDAITWTSRVIPNSNYRSITWTGTRFIAVGDASARSLDGVNWVTTTPGVILQSVSAPRFP